MNLGSLAITYVRLYVDTFYFPRLELCFLGYGSTTHSDKYNSTYSCSISHRKGRQALSSNELNIIF